MSSVLTMLPQKIAPPGSVKTLSGWGNYPREDCCVYEPDNSAAVEALLARTESDTGFIPRGLGRSYGDAAQNQNGGVILQDRLAQVLSFDPETGVVECEAGVSLAALIGRFLPRGFFLPVTPGTKYVTLGGAIASDVHGKNHHHDGTFSAFVLDLTLLTGSGETLTCSREENADVFWATVGGMGLTGFILSARLRLLPVETGYIRVDYLQSRNLDQTLDLFDENDSDYKYSVAWMDFLASGPSLGRSVLMRGNHASVADLSSSLRSAPLKLQNRPKAVVPCYAPGFVLNPLSIGLFNEAYYRGHPTREGVIVDYDTFFYPLDGVLSWNRLYGRRGFIEYQVVLPAETSRLGLVELLEKITRSRRSSFLAVLKKFGPGNPGLLSFPRPGHTLALHMPNTGPDLVSFVHELDQIALRYGGRLYLAKDAVSTPETFAAMYPTLGQFREIKAGLDPNQRLVSSQARRLGIVT